MNTLVDVHYEHGKKPSISFTKCPLLFFSLLNDCMLEKTMVEV